MTSAKKRQKLREFARKMYLVVALSEPLVLQYLHFSMPPFWILDESSHAMNSYFADRFPQQKLLPVAVRNLLQQVYVTG